MGFITFFLLKKLLNKGKTFIWNSKEQNIKAINKINTIDLKLIVGVERQKQLLIKNTESFAIGNFTNNALLWGTRGNGKSTLIKSVFLKLSQKYTSLKLIQLNKNNIFDIEKIYPISKEMNKLMNDKIYLDSIMGNGKERAIIVADSVLKKVFEVVGFTKN